jgi:RNA polymerase sigma-70 factor (ECF subfamily)
VDVLTAPWIESSVPRAKLMDSTSSTPDATRSDGAGDPPHEAQPATDLHLVTRFRAGEQRAFAELVQRYQRPIYYLALRYLNNDADAADITQTTFIRAFKALDRFRGESSLRTWLYRIAINLSLTHLRKRGREQPTDLTEVHTGELAVAPRGASGLISGQESWALRAAITALPPKQRLVLELRVYDELSFREVAELAECTENAAKVNFHLALKRLRTMMVPPAADPSGSRPAKEKNR